MSSRSWLVAGLVSGVVVPVGAQTPDSTARRLPALTVEGVRQRSVAPPVATKTVDSTVLQKTQAQDVWDLVRRTAGVEVHEQGQGPGFAADAVLRGFTSDHSSDLLLVVDGVPVNLPLHGHIEGYSDWNLVFPAVADGLRVISGPASPLYGDFAFGGVVEVTTPWSVAGSSGALGGSSFGDGSGWFQTGATKGDGGWLAAGRFERSQGWRDHASYGIGNGILRWRGRAGRGRLEGGLLGYASSWDSPGFLSVAEYNARRLTRAADSTDGGHGSRLVGHLRYSRVLSERAGISVLGWAQRVDDRVYLNIPEGDEAPAQTEETDRRTVVGGEVQVHLSAGGDWSLGASGRYDDVGYRLYDTEARRVHDSVAVYDGSFAGGALFGRWRRLIGPLAFDVGLRWDVLRYRAADLLAGAAAADATHQVVSPKFGVRYLTGGNLAFAGSVSRGFRGSPGVIGDPSRPPESVWAKEVALEYARDEARLRLALFRLDVNGERVQDPITREITGSGKSVRQGVEGSIEWPLARRLRLTASGTFTDAAISKTLAAPAALVAERGLAGAAVVPVFHLVPLSPGDPVPGVSRYLARAGLDLIASHGLTFSGLVRWNGPFTPVGEPTVKTQSYLLTDLAGTVGLGGSRWSVDWELQNLFNTRYPEVRSSGYLNPGAPRVLRAALHFR